MRLLIGLYKYFPYGGLQCDALQFALEAQARGHEVTVLTTEWDGARPEGIALEFRRPSGFTNHARMASFGRDFLNLAKSGRFDVTLAMNRIPGADFYFVADTCMAEYLPKKHSRLVLALLPRYRSCLAQEAAVCSPAGGTTLLYIAPAQKAAYQRIYHLPDERFLFLPPGIERRFLRRDDALEIRARKRGELGLRDDERVLIQVGTNLVRKGVDRVMAAMAACGDKSLRYLLAGGDNAEVVASLARLSKVEDQVMFLGPRNDVDELLLAADLMVHPAREEGAGTVLIEALASGCPVVCTEECGFASHVSEATGTVVPSPFRQDALDEMVRGCLNRLPELFEQTLRYAKGQDFTSRHRVAVEEMEHLHDRRTKG